MTVVYFKRHPWRLLLTSKGPFWQHLDQHRFGGTRYHAVGGWR